LAARIWLVLLLMGSVGGLRARAQAPDGVMSEAEVEALRDSAYVPVERIKVYEKMLDTRQKRMEELLAKPRRPGFGQDMHDLIDEFGAIADELNDNLDDYAAKHRDIRKEMPKLVAATERWSTTLRAAGEDDKYKVVRKIALDALEDTKSTAVQTQAAEETYFKEHPEAAKAEKARANAPHAPK
jgi:hypothetical protein